MSSKHRLFSFTSQIFSRINQLSDSKNRPVLCSTFQNSIIFVRRSSSVPEKQESETLPVFQKFGRDIQNIYQFPYISYCNWIVNLKWYVLPVICICAVCLEEMASEGDLDTETYDTYLLLLSVMTLKCVMIGFPFTNFVAHIFVTPECDIVLSYLNSYGSRVDEKFPKGDLFLQSRESGLFKYITKDVFYMFLISKSTNQKFRINFKHCNMFDEHLFRSIIGIIPESAV